MYAGPCKIEERKSPSSKEEGGGLLKNKFTVFMEE